MSTKTDIYSEYWVPSGMSLLSPNDCDRPNSKCGIIDDHLNLVDSSYHSRPELPRQIRGLTFHNRKQPQMFGSRVEVYQGSHPEHGDVGLKLSRELSGQIARNTARVASHVSFLLCKY